MRTFLRRCPRSHDILANLADFLPRINMPRPLVRARAIACSFLLAFSAARIEGQTGSGVIRGVVLDPQGTGVVGATVTLIVPDGGRIREVQTGSAGEFVFPNLQPDAYDIGAEAPGFK